MFLDYEIEEGTSPEGRLKAVRQLVHPITSQLERDERDERLLYESDARVE